MNQKLLKFYNKKERKKSMIFLPKRIIQKSKSPWSCSTFYINKKSKITQDTPRLIINYKCLNKTLQWIRYHIANKKDLLNNLYSTKNLFQI